MAKNWLKFGKFFECYTVTTKGDCHCLPLKKMLLSGSQEFLT